MVKLKQTLALEDIVVLLQRNRLWWYVAMEAWQQVD